MAYRNVQDLHRLILIRGGATTTVDLGDGPQGGYMVSLRGLEVTYDVDLFERHGVKYLLRYLADHFEALNAHGAYLGAWIEHDHVQNEHTVYLDVSVNIQGRQEAFELAKINGQLAIYDVENDTVLNLNDHKGDIRPALDHLNIVRNALG